MAKIVVVFDFDKTIIDCDSDNWVVDELGFTDLFNQLLPTMPWNSMMDRLMKEIHENGKTIADIEEVLKTVPIHPRIIPAFKSAHALGCDLKIVSDANRFFIETILKHYGLMEYFSGINTNPGYVDEQGRLRISPYHVFINSSHGCTCSLCPPNMCKGLVIKKIQAAVESKTRFIYLGDGNGDFCPSTKLGERDFVMPRKNFPLWDAICKNPTLINAQIQEWCDGEELERVLISLIERINLEETNQFLPMDCKYQNIPMGTHETLPQPLPVPH
ncbi:Phosphatase PHOSPHO-type [Dillenia turbinata]|uniref:Phosphatase PHOSPHO-type n=1 Tax=Dillenia turbinata TaxID=194707 RepID=A0AAN8YTE5_9MAGN